MFKLVIELRNSKATLKEWSKIILEVLVLIFKVDSYKVPGPDGVSIGFYKKS